MSCPFYNLLFLWEVGRMLLTSMTSVYNLYSLFFETWPFLYSWLPWDLHCRSGWPQTQEIFFSASASWALGSKEYTTTPDLQLVFLTIQPHQFLDSFSFPSAWLREFFSINQEMLLFKYFLLNCSNLTIFPPEVLVRIQTPGQEAF